MRQTLSVAMIAMDEEANLPRTLESVRWADEIIVVDNGSSDGSADAVGQAFPSVRVLRLPENRYIFSLNAGLSEARGEYVAFCNNDMTVEESFVEKALECFVSDEIFAVCARVVDRGAALQQNGVAHTGDLQKGHAGWVRLGSSAGQMRVERLWRRLAQVENGVSKPHWRRRGRML